MSIHITNARVLTMHAAHATAGSITIDAGRIVALDEPAPAGAERVDAGGGVLLPGLIDPHVHLLAAAAAQRSVDCSPRSVRSIASLQQRLHAAAAGTHDTWIRAVGYDEFALAEQRHPTRWDLDRAVADRPVRLRHRSGHAVVCNSLALALVGITTESEEPPGGVIDRRLEDGEPSGLLIDMDSVVDRAVPPLPFDALAAGMSAVSDQMLRAGVTAVQDMTHRNDQARLTLLNRVLDAAAFAPRRLPPATAPGVAGAGPVKLMLPEAAGLHAAVREQVTRTVASAHNAGRQVAIHATSADGLALALEAIAQALTRRPRPDHRHRIEHAAIAPPSLAKRAARLGVVVVSNPVFLTESGPRYRATVPPSALPHLYATAALCRAGTVTAAASDAPVAPSEPLRGVIAAITRRDADGTPTPGEPAEPDHALAMVTRSAAFAAFAETRIGALTPGMSADLVLLDGPPEGARPPAVLWTVIGGVPVHVAPQAPPFSATANNAQDRGTGA